MLNIRRLIEKLCLTVLIKNSFYCMRIKKKYIYIFFFFSLINKFKVFFIKKYFVIKNNYKKKYKVKSICYISHQVYPRVHLLSQTETGCGRLSETWFDLLGGQTCCV